MKCVCTKSKKYTSHIPSLLSSIISNILLDIEPNDMLLWMLIFLPCTFISTCIVSRSIYVCCALIKNNVSIYLGAGLEKCF